MKRKGKTSSAFTKIRAGLEDAIAFHAGDRQLTVRDVELEAAGADGRQGAARSPDTDARLAGRLRADTEREPEDGAGLGDGCASAIRCGAEAPHGRQGASGGAVRLRAASPRPRWRQPRGTAAPGRQGARAAMEYPRGRCFWAAISAIAAGSAPMPAPCGRVTCCWRSTTASTRVLAARHGSQPVGITREQAAANGRRSLL